MVTITLTPKEALALQLALQWEPDPFLKRVAAKLKAAR